MTVQIQLDGEYDRLVHALNNFAGFRQKFKTTALRKMAQAHKKQIRERLVTKKSGPDGESWKPWAESTRKKRESEGTASSGLLYRAKPRSLANSFKTAFTAGRGKLGSPRPYAAVQHFGGGRIPGRPYAGVGRTDIPELTRTLNQWVARNHPFK